MNPAVETFTNYLARVAPGLVLTAAVLVLTRWSPRLRIVIYLAMFVLLRDAMTPLGLWSFGNEAFFWIRLGRDSPFMVAFGLASIAIVLLLHFLDRQNRSLVRWTRGNLFFGAVFGLAAALVVVTPCMALYRHTPIDARGGPVPLGNLPALLTFTLLGNLVEEMLFRGYVYGWLSEQMAPIRAGLTSGVIFAFCHIFLAITVTNVGYSLLLFTLWEGMIAGVVGAKSGVFASTLTHGGAIFLLSAGLM